MFEQVCLLGIISPTLADRTTTRTKVSQWWRTSEFTLYMTVELPLLIVALLSALTVYCPQTVAQNSAQVAHSVHNSQV